MFDINNDVNEPILDIVATGNSIDNKITGSVGNDQIMGLAGNDTLYGMDGDDYLDGGVGSDLYHGGTGKDIFVLTDFSVYAELGIPYAWDHIADFNPAVDKIKLPQTVQFKDLIFTQATTVDGSPGNIHIKIQGDNGDLVLAEVAPTYTTLEELADKNNFIGGFEVSDLRIETINDAENIIVSGKVADKVVEIELEFEIKPTGAPSIALGDIDINDDTGISAKPISINGYYPLYTSEEMANNASEGNGTSHAHTFDGSVSGTNVTYHMPNGLAEFYHGDHDGTYQENDYGSDGYFIVGFTLPDNTPNGEIKISGGYYRVDGEDSTPIVDLDMSETYTSPDATELNNPALSNLSMEIVAGPDGVPFIKLSGQYTDESPAQTLRLSLNLEKKGDTPATDEILHGYEFALEGDQFLQ